MTTLSPGCQGNPSATMLIPCVVLPTKQMSSGSQLSSRPARLRVSSTRWVHG